MPPARSPVYIGFDSDNSPSGLNIYQDADVVGESNGGTGVTSISDFGLSLSSTTVSGYEVCAANFYVSDAGAFNCVGNDGVKFFMKRENGGTYENLIKSDEGTITVQSEDDIHFISNTGEKFMRLNESGGNGEVELYYNNSLKLETVNAGVEITGAMTSTTVSATDLTASTINGVPYPNPFSYVQMTAAGTNSTDEQNFATGAAVNTIESKTYGASGIHDITWDNNNKYFNVSTPGTYEILGNFVVDAGSQSDPIEITSKKNGSDVHVISPKLYGTVGPEERTFHSVLTAAAGDYITVTLHMDDGGTKTAHLESGSNLMLKRIL